MGLQMPGSVFVPDSSSVSWFWGHIAYIFRVSLGRRRALSSQQHYLGSPTSHGQCSCKSPENKASAFMVDDHILQGLQADAFHSA